MKTTMKSDRPSSLSHPQLHGSCKLLQPTSALRHVSKLLSVSNRPSVSCSTPANLQTTSTPAQRGHSDQKPNRFVEKSGTAGVAANSRSSSAIPSWLHSRTGCATGKVSSFNHTSNHVPSRTSSETSSETSCQTSSHTSELTSRQTSNQTSSQKTSQTSRKTPMHMSKQSSLSGSSSSSHQSLSDNRSRCSSMKRKEDQHTSRCSSMKRKEDQHTSRCSSMKRKEEDQHTSRCSSMKRNDESLSKGRSSSILRNEEILQKERLERWKVDVDATATDTEEWSDSMAEPTTCSSQSTLDSTNESSTFQDTSSTQSSKNSADSSTSLSSVDMTDATSSTTIVPIKLSTNSEPSCQFHCDKMAYSLPRGKSAGSLTKEVSSKINCHSRIPALTKIRPLKSIQDIISSKPKPDSKFAKSTKIPRLTNHVRNKSSNDLSSNGSSKLSLDFYNTPTQCISCASSLGISIDDVTGVVERSDATPSTPSTGSLQSIDNSRTSLAKSASSSDGTLNGSAGTSDSSESTLKSSSTIRHECESAVVKNTSPTISAQPRKTTECKLKSLLPIYSSSNCKSNDNSRAVNKCPGYDTTDRYKSAENLSLKVNSENVKGCTSSKKEIGRVFQSSNDSVKEESENVISLCKTTDNNETNNDIRTNCQKLCTNAGAKDTISTEKSKHEDLNDHSKFQNTDVIYSGSHTYPESMFMENLPPISIVLDDITSAVSSGTDNCGVVSWVSMVDGSELENFCQIFSNDNILQSLPMYDPQLRQVPARNSEKCITEMAPSKSDSEAVSLKYGDVSDTTANDSEGNLSKNEKRGKLNSICQPKCVGHVGAFSRIKDKQNELHFSSTSKTPRIAKINCKVSNNISSRVSAQSVASSRVSYKPRKSTNVSLKPQSRLSGKQSAASKLAGSKYEDKTPGTSPKIVQDDGESMAGSIGNKIGVYCSEVSETENSDSVQEDTSLTTLDQQDTSDSISDIAQPSYDWMNDISGNDHISSNENDLVVRSKSDVSLHSVLSKPTKYSDHSFAVSRQSVIDKSEMPKFEPSAGLLNSKMPPKIHNVYNKDSKQEVKAINSKESKSDKHKLNYYVPIRNRSEELHSQKIQHRPASSSARHRHSNEHQFLNEGRVKAPSHCSPCSISSCCKLATSSKAHRDMAARQVRKPHHGNVGDFYDAGERQNNVIKSKEARHYRADVRESIYEIKEASSNKLELRKVSPNSIKNSRNSKATVLPKMGHDGKNKVYNDKLTCEMRPPTHRDHRKSLWSTEDLNNWCKQCETSTKPSKDPHNGKYDMFNEFTLDNTNINSQKDSNCHQKLGSDSKHSTRLDELAGLLARKICQKLEEANLTKCDVIKVRENKMDLNYQSGDEIKPQAYDKSQQRSERRRASVDCKCTQTEEVNKCCCSVGVQVKSLPEQDDVGIQVEDLIALDSIGIQTETVDALVTTASVQTNINFCHEIYTQTDEPFIATTFESSTQTAAVCTRDAECLTTEDECVNRCLMKTHRSTQTDKTGSQATLQNDVTRKINNMKQTDIQEFRPSAENSNFTIRLTEDDQDDLCSCVSTSVERTDNSKKGVSRHSQRQMIVSTIPSSTNEKTTRKLQKCSPRCNSREAKLARLIKGAEVSTQTEVSHSMNHCMGLMPTEKIPRSCLTKYKVKNLNSHTCKSEKCDSEALQYDVIINTDPNDVHNTMVAKPRTGKTVRKVREGTGKLEKQKVKIISTQTKDQQAEFGSGKVSFLEDDQMEDNQTRSEKSAKGRTPSHGSVRNMTHLPSNWNINTYLRTRFPRDLASSTVDQAGDVKYDWVKTCVDYNSGVTLLELKKRKALQKLRAIQKHLVDSIAAEGRT